MLHLLHDLEAIRDEAVAVLGEIIEARQRDEQRKGKTCDYSEANRSGDEHVVARPEAAEMPESKTKEAKSTVKNRKSEEKEARAPEWRSSADCPS